MTWTHCLPITCPSDRPSHTASPGEALFSGIDGPRFRFVTGCFKLPRRSELHRYQIAQIGEKLTPQNDVPQRLAEIDRDREAIVHCRSGARSQRVAEFLKQAGYPQVVNLAGGILAWADEIDPKMQKY